MEGEKGKQDIRGERKGKKKDGRGGGRRDEKEGWGCRNANNNGIGERMEKKDGGREGVGR